MPIILNTNLTPWQAQPLSTNEQAGNAGYTHIATLSANNLTQASTNTAQPFTICALKAGDVIGKVAFRVKRAFQDADDTAFNSDTISIGDTAAVDTYITAKEVNANGSVITEAISASTTPTVYTAADILKIVVNSMSGKALVNIDVGEVEVLFQILRPANLANAVSEQPLTK